MPSGRASQAVLPVLLLAAAAARFWRLGPGEPYIDSLKFVDEAVRMVQQGTLRPASFQHPGLFTGLLAGLCALSGTGAAAALAKTLSAAFGLGTVWAVWLAAGRIGGRPARLVAAALAASSIVCLSYGRMGTTDTAVCFFLTLALATLAGRPRPPRSWALTGALVGLAAGAKFTGLFALPFLVGAALSAAWRHQDRKIAYLGLPAGLAAAAAAFLLSTPYFLALSGPYLRRMSLEALLQASGQVGEIHLGWSDYLWSRTPVWEAPWLGTSLLANLGPVLLAACALAALAALSGRFGFGPFLYASFAVLYLASVSGPGHLKAARFLMPALPPLYALTGWAAEAFVLERLRRGRALALAALCAVLAAVPAFKCLGYLRRLGRPTTGDEAFAWVSKNVPPGSGVFMSPFFTHRLYALPLAFLYQEDMGARIYRLPQGPSPERDPIYHPGLVDALQSAGARYLVLNSYFDAAFSPVPENLRWFPRSVEGYRAFRERLKEKAELLYSAKGESEGRFGPDIEVWKLKG